MAGLVTQRLQITHDPIASVDVVVQLIAGLTKTGTHLLAGPLNHFVHIGNGVRIADAAQADKALAHFARAFQLHPDLGIRQEPGAGHPCRALVELLVVAVRHVKLAAGKELLEGVGTLVHSVA